MFTCPAKNASLSTTTSGPSRNVVFGAEPRDGSALVEEVQDIEPEREAARVAELQRVLQAQVRLRQGRCPAITATRPT